MGGSKSLIGLAVIAAAAMAASQWWVATQEQRLGRQVAGLAGAGDIHMLSSNTCPICTRARLWFKANEVKFDECFIETDRQCALLFEATRAPGTPAILVRGQAQVGFDPRRIAARLSGTDAAAGALNPKR
jgi:glutaredoxin